MQEQSKGATIKDSSTERERKDGYEAEMMVDGHSKDIQIAGDGTLNEIEEEVAFATLPANVQAGLKRKQEARRSRKSNRLRSMASWPPTRQRPFRVQKKERSRLDRMAARSLTKNRGIS